MGGVGHLGPEGLATDAITLGILISGRGSNMQALVNACHSGLNAPATVGVVIANSSQASGIEWAQQQGVATAVFDNGNYTRDAQEAAILACLQHHNVNLVCLAGYMRIVSPRFIQAMGGQVLNIHPSLLPRHGGPGLYGAKVHQAVLAAGDTESGCTVHWVTAEVDAGPIVVQHRVPVLPDDTVATLAQRVLAQEHQAYPKALAHVAAAQQRLSLERAGP